MAKEKTEVTKTKLNPSVTKDGYEGVFIDSDGRNYPVVIKQGETEIEITDDKVYYEMALSQLIVLGATDERFLKYFTK